MSGVEVLRIAATLGMLAGWAWVAWGLAARGWGEEARSSRIAAALLLAVALPVGWANVLLAVGGFSLATMLLSVPLAAWVGRAPSALLRTDAAAVRTRVTHAVKSRWAWVILPALLCAGLRFVRGAAAPPLAWDSLTYHLFRAAQWVQSGRQTFTPAPSSWGYYQPFAYAGDRLWAVVMLTHNDVLVPLASSVVWGLVPVMVWALGRTVGATRAGAGLAALGVGWAQAILALQTTAYVDNLVNALTVATVLFGLRAWIHRRGADAALFLLAGVAAAATKTSLVPVGAAACVVGAGLMLRSRVSPTVWAGTGGLTLALALPWWTNAQAFGNPFFPFALRVAGHTLLPGDEEMSKLAAGTFFGAAGPPRWEGLWDQLFFALPGPTGSAAVGFGPTGLLLLAVAAMGAWRQRRAGPVRLLGAAGVVVTLLFVQALLDSGMRSYLTDWLSVTPRLVAPAFALLGTLAAFCPPRAVFGVALVLAWGHAALGLPFGASAADGPAALWVIFAAALLLLPRRLGLFTLPFTLAAVPILQGPDRWARWLPVERGERVGFDLHPLNQFSARAAAAWDFLDQDTPRRIVVVPAAAGNGQTLYLYPLLGRHFQNTLHYVPPTSDAQVPDLFDTPTLVATADAAAWLRRVDALRPDYLYLVAPEPVEEAWVRARPTVFRPVFSPRKPVVTVFEVDAAALHEAAQSAAAPSAAATPPAP